jgi:hypothetical protein
MRAPGPDVDERRRRATRAPVPDEEEEGAPLSLAPSAANGSTMAVLADRRCVAQIDDSRPRSSVGPGSIAGSGFCFFVFKSFLGGRHLAASKNSDLHRQDLRGGLCAHLQKSIFAICENLVCSSVTQDKHTYKLLELC